MFAWKENCAFNARKLKLLPASGILSCFIEALSYEIKRMLHPNVTFFGKAGQRQSPIKNRATTPGPV